MLDRSAKRAAGFAAAVILGLGLLARADAVVPPPEAQGPMRHVFDLYAGGIWVGEAVLDAKVGEESYVAGARLRTAGLVRALFDASFVAETTGRIDGRGMEPERFAATTEDNRKKQDVEIGYVDGQPLRVKAEPAFKVRDYSLDPARQGSVADPLTGALSALAPRADGFCDRRIEMFDGQRRFALVFGAPRPDGERVSCAAAYERVAGFKAKMMKPDRRTIPFTMSFRERPDGLWEPVRALIETDFANLSLVRRD